MIELDDREVAVIERGDLMLAQALDDGEHRGVHEAEAQVVVGRHERSRSRVVAVDEILDDECSALHVVEEAGERVRGDEVVELDEHRRRHDSRIAPSPQQLCAANVVAVVAVEQRDERPGVDYERNGGGS